MTNYNLLPKKINFQDFMSDKGSDCLHNFLDTLSDCGIYVATSQEEFLDDEYAFQNAEQLGDSLVFYGKWLAAKVTAFESLCDLGFQAIKAKADRCETIAFQPHYGEGLLEGEWCRWNGIVFASFNDVIEVAAASEDTTQFRRNKADLRTAQYLLAGIQNSSREVTEAA